MHKHYPHTITHVIYDMDGLLLNTEILYTEVTQIVVGRFGKTFDWNTKANMIGRPARDSAQYLVTALELPITAEQYLEDRNELLEQRFPHCTAMPGAEQLVRSLHQYGVPQGLATSSGQRLFSLKTQKHTSWFDLFDCIVTFDDPEVIHGKPAPDIFLTAAKRLGADPRHCLVFEDAPSGTRAAMAAGMAVIAVPDPNLDTALFQGAHQILDSLHDFRPQEWGLPAAD